MSVAFDGRVQIITASPDRLFQSKFSFSVAERNAWTTHARLEAKEQFELQVSSFLLVKVNFMWIIEHCKILKRATRSETVCLVCGPWVAWAELARPMEAEIANRAERMCKICIFKNFPNTYRHESVRETARPRSLRGGFADF